MHLGITAKRAMVEHIKNLRFLADRTNGRAIATLLRLSSVCLSVCL